MDSNTRTIIRRSDEFNAGSLKDRYDLLKSPGIRGGHAVASLNRDDSPPRKSTALGEHVSGPTQSRPCSANLNGTYQLTLRPFCPY